MIPTNPFLLSARRPSVFVAHGGGPYANACAALALLDLTAAREKRVLLKPNIGRLASPATGVNTHPRVVAAAIDVLRQAGAEVAVGESPIMGVDVMKAFEQSGVTAVAQARDCPLIDMDRRDCVELDVPDGHVVHRLKGCPEALEFDFVVSIPVMKTHMHTGATLGVKNMKGCLWRKSKVQLHMLPPLEGSDEKPINVAIADMSAVLRPHLTLIDGTVGMEGLGPSAGRPKPLDVVVAGADAFAADAVACRLMGLKAEQVPHLRIGAARGYGTIDLNRIAVAPENWQDWISPFLRPPENLAIQFPNVTLWDNRSCSACQSTLLLFLTQHRERLFDYFGTESPINVAIGKGHTELPEQTLCLGNCTAKHKHQGVFVPGCPPVGSQILAALAQKPPPPGGGSDAEREDK
ncbi:MAG: DUF362 domain-containing protein [Planctomycetota bacterium]